MKDHQSSDWHIITYDIRCPKRWRKVYRLLRGHGNRLQYSVFRVRATSTQFERLRWELEALMEEDDDLFIVSLCPRCGQRVKSRHSEDAWPEEGRVRFTD